MITIKAKSGRTYNILHHDHGIDTPQLEKIINRADRCQITNHPERFGLTDSLGFFIKLVQLDEGTVPCGLYGPAMGDAPVPDDQVILEKRGDREWTDRIIDRPTRDVTDVQVIGIREEEVTTVFTVYGGPLAPQNPKDPSCEDVDASTKFWSEHALV